MFYEIISTMPRKQDTEDTRRHDSESESDYSTDSDDDYKPSQEFCNTALQNGNCPLQVKDIEEVYVKQRGVCRITGLLFGQDMYSPIAVKRTFKQDWSPDNCVVVLISIERMRVAANNMPWRQFTRWLQVIGKDADL